VLCDLQKNRLLKDGAVIAIVQKALDTVSSVTDTLHVSNTDTVRGIQCVQSG